MGNIFQIMNHQGNLFFAVTKADSTEVYCLSFSGRIPACGNSSEQSGGASKALCPLGYSAGFIFVFLLLGFCCTWDETHSPGWEDFSF